MAQSKPSSKLYGSISAEEAQHIAGSIGNTALTEANLKLQELKKYAEEGQWTWKIAGFFAGLLIVITSSLGLLSNFFGLSFFTALLDVYAIGFGALACVLEYKDVLLTASAREVIRREALFLYRPYGRAAFYFFIGLLMVAKGGLLGFIVGAYTMLVGVIIFTSSRSAVAALDEIRNSMKTEKDVALKFAQFDTDNSGALDSAELARLCRSLGAQQTLNELEAALFVLDKNADGKISYEEFIDWWQGRDDHIV
jgi:hypothetical protein